MQGLENRTNLMIKNVPCRYKKVQIQEFIGWDKKQRYNEVKLPQDKNARETVNKGYCFINFRHPLYVLDFLNEKKGECWPLYESNKRVDNYFAKV